VRNNVSIYGDENFSDSVSDDLQSLKSTADSAIDGINKIKNASNKSGSNKSASSNSANNSSGHQNAATNTGVNPNPNAGVGTAGSANAASSGAGAASGTASGAASSTAGGAAAGASTGAAAGSAAGGAAAGASTGAAAGSVAGPVGAAVGATVAVAGKPILKAIIVILVVLILVFSFTIMNLPRVIFGAIFDLFSFEEEIITVQDGATEIISEAYSAAYESIMALTLYNPEYDLELTQQNLIDLSGGATNVDMAYLMAAYSVSMQNLDGATGNDLKDKLRQVKNSLYRKETAVAVAQKPVPLEVPLYGDPYSVTVAVTPAVRAEVYYVIDGYKNISNTEGTRLPIYQPTRVTVVNDDGSTSVEDYRQLVENRYVYYSPSDSLRVPIMKAVRVQVPITPVTEVVTAYKEIGTTTITTSDPLPLYHEKEFDVLVSENQTETQTHLVEVGTVTHSIEMRDVKYIQATILPLNRNDLNEALGLDLNGIFYQPKFSSNPPTTNLKAVSDMTEKYLLLLKEQGIIINTGSGVPSGVPVAPPDLSAIAPDLIIEEMSDNRKLLIEIGAALCGKVPYFLGGGHGDNYGAGGLYFPAGWNDAWNNVEATVKSGGKAGQTRPLGLDCSGYVKWVYKTAFGYELFSSWAITDNMLSDQYTNRVDINDLRPGDLGVSDSHVAIYVGKNSAGKRMWMHSRDYDKPNGQDIWIATYYPEGHPDGFTHYRRVRAVEAELEGDNLRQEADLMTRLGLAASTTSDYDYTLPEYEWIAQLANQPESAPVTYSKTLKIKYYCQCPECSGSETTPLTQTGKEYRVGVVASKELETGSVVSLFGKLFTVDDEYIGAEDDVIYVYIPNHDLFSKLATRVVSVPVYR
jgi:hypothetical protein